MQYIGVCERKYWKLFAIYLKVFHYLNLDAKGLMQHGINSRYLQIFIDNERSDALLRWINDRIPFRVFRVLIDFLQSRMDFTIHSPIPSISFHKLNFIFSSYESMNSTAAISTTPAFLFCIINFIYEFEMGLLSWWSVPSRDRGETAAHISSAPFSIPRQYTDDDEF